MKRFLIAAAVVTGLGLLAILSARDGQAQGQSGLPGIGQKPGSSNPLPWLESKANPNGSGAFYPAPSPIAPKQEWNQPPDGPDPNDKYFVKHELGPWMILITSYTSDRQTSDMMAKQLANQMVQELRTNYKLQAYVFNYGEEDRRKEAERVEIYKKQMREQMRSMGAADDTPIGRVPRIRIDIQCAVLVGGYKDDAAARRELNRIRAIKVGPQELARLPAQYDMVLINPAQGKGENAKINPFLKSHVVPNPAIRQERSAQTEKLDISILRRLNADEGYSLLKCPKPWTLAVKQFLVPAVVQPKEATNGTLLQKLGLGSNTGSGEEMTALKGHKLAELLRGDKWEAYVLHTKYASIVTVGGYDRPNDPCLLRDQQALVQWSAKLPQAVQLFPQTMPMPVPR